MVAHLKRCNWKYKISLMNSHCSSICIGVVIVCSFNIVNCSNRGIRDVEIRYRDTASTTYDIIELAATRNANSTPRFLVSGSELQWEFSDLNNDGKLDIAFSSKVHKSYFARFIISDHDPKIQLLRNEGINVTILNNEHTASTQSARPRPTPPPHDPRPLLHRRSPKANSFQPYK